MGYGEVLSGTGTPKAEAGDKVTVSWRDNTGETGEGETTIR